MQAKPQSKSPETGGITSGDGRRARRERGRLAVIDAKIDLVFEGFGSPSADLIAERAGVSVASVFRYFDTLDDLGEAGALRFFDRTDHLMAIPDIGEGSLDDRIHRLVNARIALYETTAPMCRLARVRMHALPGARENIKRARMTRVDQIRHHFDTELNSLTPAVRDDTVYAISIITAFDAWDQLMTTYERTPQQIRRSWRMGVTRVLNQPA